MLETTGNDLLDRRRLISQAGLRGRFLQTWSLACCLIAGVTQGTGQATEPRGDSSRLVEPDSIGVDDEFRFVPLEPADCSRRPWYVVTLISGEQFIAELWAADEATITLRRGPGFRVKLRREVVDSIGNPPQTQELWRHEGQVLPDQFVRDFTNPVEKGQFQVWLPELMGEEAEEISAGRADCRMLFDHPPKLPTDDLGFKFSSWDGGAIEIPQDWKTTFRQDFRESSRNRAPLIISWSPVAWMIQRGAVLLAAGTKPAGGLRSIQLSQEKFRTAWETPWVRQYRAGSLTDPPGDRSQDALVLADQSILYGHCQGSSREGIRFVFRGTELAIPWPEFHCLWFRSPPQTLEVPAQSQGTALHGTIVQAMRSPIGGPWPVPEELWWGAVQKSGSDGRFLAHAWLGPRVPLPESATLHSVSEGDWIWLCPGSVHLGDEIRDDLASPVPRGTSLSGSWTLSDQPESQGSSCWISAEVVDLEPAAGKTPATSPFLKSLQHGELVTQLWVNRRHIANWNDALSWRPSSLDPVRVRIPIPAGVVHAGINTWEMRQIPEAATGGYDDMEFRSIALELRPQRHQDLPQGSRAARVEPHRSSFWRDWLDDSVLQLMRTLWNSGE